VLQSPIVLRKLGALICNLEVHVQFDYKLDASLFQQPTLSDMTMYELNFSLLVEQMLSKIVDPAYRQIMVEVGEHL
jgi:hypothetical protein